MKLALKADRLIDGTGVDAVPNGVIVIENGRIAAVTTQEALQFAQGEEVDVIEVNGGSIMPGFIEMHSHIHCSAEEDAYTHIMTETDEVFLMRAVNAVRGCAFVRRNHHARPGGAQSSSLSYQAGDRGRHHPRTSHDNGRHSHHDYRWALQHVRHGS